MATIRVIVAGLLPQTEPNALLHLFSASRSLLEYGRQHCPVRSPETSTLVADLFAGYTVEGLTMPITMEEYIRQAERRAVLRAPVSMRLDGLTPEQLLDKLLQDESVQQLTPEAREKLRRLYEELPPA